MNVLFLLLLAFNSIINWGHVAGTVQVG